MKSDRDAKRVLKAFGKEAYRERIAYVDSFLTGKTSFFKSISYRHTFKRAAVVALLTILIFALAVSTYAAVMHYLNYEKESHDGNDEYVHNANGELQTDESIDSYFEPEYIPFGYTLSENTTDDLFGEKTWVYENESGNSLIIFQSLEGADFHVDNERPIMDIINVGDIQVTEYSFDDEILAFMQYENTVITIQGGIDSEELEKIIKGMHITE